MTEDANPPPGFKPWLKPSPYLDTVGPFFYRIADDGTFVAGLRVLPKHANSRGTAHGGLLMSLIDVALGYGTSLSQDPPVGLTTAALSADFAGSPKVGDWVEAHVDVQRVGGRFAFANTYLSVNGERLVRASAVFARGNAKA